MKKTVVFTFLFLTSGLCAAPCKDELFERFENIAAYDEDAPYPSLFRAIIKSTRDRQGNPVRLFFDDLRDHERKIVVENLKRYCCVKGALLADIKRRYDHHYSESIDRKNIELESIQGFYPNSRNVIWNMFVARNVKDNVCVVYDPQYNGVLNVCLNDNKYKVVCGSGFGLLTREARQGCLKLACTKITSGSEFWRSEIEQLIQKNAPLNQKGKESWQQYNRWINTGVDIKTALFYGGGVDNDLQQLFSTKNIEPCSDLLPLQDRCHLIMKIGKLQSLACNFKRNNNKNHF